MSNHLSGDGAALWRKIKYYAVRDLADNVGTADAGGGGGGGATDHGDLTGLSDDDHSHYYNQARGDARYETISSADSWRTTHLATAHHDRLHTPTNTGDHDFTGWSTGDVLYGNGSGTATYGALSYAYLTSRQHSITGADHSIFGDQYSVVGNPAGSGTLGLWTATSDGATAHSLLKSDAAGALTLATLYSTSVDTPTLTNIGSVAISPTVDAVISPTSDIDLAPGGNILSGDVQKYYDFFPGFPVVGASIDWASGTAYFKDLQVENLYAETFIVEAKRAYAGGAWFSKSATYTTRPFSVPPAGSEADIYVADIPGLSGFNAFDNNDFLLIRYIDVGIPTDPKAHTVADLIYSAGEGASGGTTTYYGPENFEGYSAGADPTDWTDTDTGNSMSGADHFDVQSFGGTKAFGTTEAGSNFHTHWTGTDHETLSSYCITGRFRTATATAGIGFTLGSDYTNSDTYYRIRRYGTGGNADFHINNHGGLTCSGTTTSSYDPAVDTWIDFRIEFEDTGTRTEIRARFWTGTEPGTWDIDCFDDDVGRRSAGTFGFWGFQSGSGVYYDDIEVESLAAGGGGSAIDLTFRYLDGWRVGDLAILTLVVESDAGVISTPSGYSPISTVVDSPYEYRAFYRVIDGTEGITFTASATGVTEQFQGLLYAVRGQDGATPSATIGSGTGTSVSVPSQTLTDAPGSIVSLLMRPDGTVVTTVAGDALTVFSTLRTVSGGAKVSYTLIDRHELNSGAYSGESFSWDTSSAFVRFTFTFNAANAASGSALIGSVWGQVSAASQVYTDDGEHAYRWTTIAGSAAQGKVIPTDSAVIDFGQSGDPYIEIDAYGPDAPLLTMSSWSGADPIAGTHTHYIGLGRLDPLTGGTDEFGLNISAGVANQSAKLSTEEFLLLGVPLTFMNGAAERFTVDRFGNLKLGPDIAGGDVDVSYSVTTGDFEIGDYSGGNAGVLWDSSESELNVRGAVNITGGAVPWANLSGIPGGTDIATMFVGAPSGSGLYLTDTDLGFYSGGEWLTRMTSTGTFMLRNSATSGVTNRSLYWNGTELSFYDSSSVRQAYISSTTGKIFSAGGKVSLSSTGINLTHYTGDWSAGTDDESAITWNAGDATIVAGEYDNGLGTDNRFIHVNAEGTTAQGLRVVQSKLSATLGGYATPRVWLESSSNVNETQVLIDGDGYAVNIEAGDVDISTSVGDIVLTPNRAVVLGTREINFGGVGSNYDGLWSDDSSDIFYFYKDAGSASPTGYAVGTAKVAAGRFLIRADRYGSSATYSGFANLWVDSDDGDLKVTFPNGTTKTIATD